MKNKLKIWPIIFVLILLLAVFVRFGSNGFLFDYRVTFVMSGSMEPNVPVSSLLLEKKFNDEDSLSVGEVITFRTSVNEDIIRVTHRIEQIIGPNIYTKGDANPHKDNWIISFNDIESKVLIVYPYTLQTFAIILFLILFSDTIWKYIHKKQNLNKK